MDSLRAPLSWAMEPMSIYWLSLCHLERAKACWIYRLDQLYLHSIVKCIVHIDWNHHILHLCSRTTVYDWTCHHLQSRREAPLPYEQQPVWLLGTRFWVERWVNPHHGRWRSSSFDPPLPCRHKTRMAISSPGTVSISGSPWSASRSYLTKKTISLRPSAVWAINTTSW